MGYIALISAARIAAGRSKRKRFPFYQNVQHHGAIIRPTERELDFVRLVI